MANYPKKKFIADVAANARDYMAEKYFDEEKVFATIKDAATKGHDRVQIYQDKADALTLQETEAANKLTALLRKQGFDVGFSFVHRQELAANKTQDLIKYKEMVITWGSSETVHTVSEFSSGEAWEELQNNSLDVDE